MNRKYSLEEIDGMRSAIRGFYWTYSGEAIHLASERSSEIENRLRTYMANGTTPEEIEQRRKEIMDAEFVRYYKQRAETAVREAKTTGQS